MKPSESLAKTLDKARGKGGRPQKRPNYRNLDDPETDVSHSTGNSTFYGLRRLSSEDREEGVSGPQYKGCEQKNRTKFVWRG